jgi:hypothetical protein
MIGGFRGWRRLAGFPLSFRLRAQVLLLAAGRK